MALAAERTPLIGRGREIARLLSSLERGERLVTVTGPSGMGKTRLVLRVARDAAPLFQAVRVVRLASLRRPSDVEAAVAEAVEVAQPQRLDLAGLLAERGKLLLVLDNLEHLLPEVCPLLDSWLDRAPALQILVSSIVPSGIEGEVHFELGPLAADDACALYLDRAQRAAADRDFSEEELREVRELVLRLDGLPLAIELAAARIRVLSPGQLLERIDDRFALLESGKEGRHASLWEALSLSWELLSERERRALAYASVFERGFDWDAAEAVLGPVAEGGSVLELVDGLRAKALVQSEDEVPPRFSLYESVRAFAARKLEAMGLEEDALLRHALHYVERAEQESQRCHGPDAPQAIRWLLAERENLVAVQRRLAGCKPELAGRAGVALAEVLALSGPPQREEEILTTSLRLARSAREPRLEGEALWRRARAYKRIGKLTEALDDIQQGLELARQLGDRPLKGRLLLESGAVHTLLGNYDEALPDLMAARNLGREVKIREFEGVAWLILGVTEENRGRNDEALASFFRALEVFEEVGHLRYQGVTRLNLGAVCSHLGRSAEARRHLAESRRISRLLENPASEANVLLNLGGSSLMDGNLVEAEGWLEEALALERQLGNPRVRGLALAGLAQISLERGQTERAAAQFDEALALLRPVREWRYVSTYLPFQALCLARLGRYPEAQEAMREARAAFGRVNDTTSLEIVDLLEEVVRLHEANGHGDSVEEAAARIRAALDVPVTGPSTEATFIARRLARQSLERLASPTSVLRVGPEGAWFEWGGERVDLRRRTAVRLMFRALVENLVHRPGVGMSADALVAIGWPGERILPEAAAARVYSGIRTLRSLGLEEILLRHADGYLLDPEVKVEWD